MSDSTVRHYRKLYREQRPTDLRPLLEEDNDRWRHYPSSPVHYIAPVGSNDERSQEVRKRWMHDQGKYAKSRFAIYAQRHAELPFSMSHIKESISLHGVFAWDVLSHEFWQLGGKVVDEGLVDPLEWEVLLLEKLDVKRRVTEPSDWSHIQWQTFRFLMEQSVFCIASDTGGLSLLIGWYDANARGRICELCGHRFDLVWVPSYQYRFSHFQKNCCFSCRILENPSRSQLEERIRAFVDQCGFIPPSGSTPVYWPFTSRLDHDSWLVVTTRYAEMGGMAYVLSHFDSWFQAMAVTGALPDGVQVTARGIRCLARDGHVCLSLDEQTIDNWLTDHGLEHEREPRYPAHKQLNPGALRADFRVGDVWIEYFGMTGNDQYDAKTRQKLKLADELGISLIAIYPWEINNLERKMSCLLSFDESRGSDSLAERKRGDVGGSHVSQA